MKLKEINITKDIAFVISILAGIINLFLFLLLVDEGIRMISPPNSSGDTEVALGVMCCGATFLIFVIFIILLIIVYTKMKKEHLFVFMILDIIALFILLISNILVRFV